MCQLYVHKRKTQAHFHLGLSNTSELPCPFYYNEPTLFLYSGFLHVVLNGCVMSERGCFFAPLFTLLWIDLKLQHPLIYAWPKVMYAIRNFCLRVILLSLYSTIVATYFLENLLYSSLCQDTNICQRNSGHIL